MKLAFSTGVFFLATLITGCADDLKNFQCSRADLDLLQTRLGQLRGDRSESTSGSTHSMVATWNQKIADVCPAPALRACATGFLEEVGQVGQHSRVVGPINAFGVYSQTEVRERWSHDGFARVRDYEVYYVTSVNRTRFVATLNCFRDRVN